MLKRMGSLLKSANASGELAKAVESMPEDVDAGPPALAPQNSEPPPNNELIEPAKSETVDLIQQENSIEADTADASKEEAPVPTPDVSAPAQVLGQLEGAEPEEEFPSPREMDRASQSEEMIGDSHHPQIEIDWTQADPVILAAPPRNGAPPSRGLTNDSASDAGSIPSQGEDVFYLTSGNTEKTLAELLLGMPAPFFKPPAPMQKLTPMFSDSPSPPRMNPGMTDMYRRLKETSPEKLKETDLLRRSSSTSLKPLPENFLHTLMSNSSQGRNGLSSVIAERPIYHGIRLGQSSAGAAGNNLKNYKPAHPNRAYGAMKLKGPTELRAASAPPMTNYESYVPENDPRRPVSSMDIFGTAGDTMSDLWSEDGSQRGPRSPSKQTVPITESKVPSKKAKLITIPLKELINGAVTRGDKREYRLFTSANTENVAFTISFLMPKMASTDLKCFVKSARRASKSCFDDTTGNQGVGEEVEEVFALGASEPSTIYICIDASESRHSFPSYQFTFRVVAKPHTESMLFGRKRRLEDRFKNELPDPRSIIRKDDDLDLDYFYVAPAAKNVRSKPWTSLIASLGQNGNIDTHTTQPRGALTFGDSVWTSGSGIGAPSSLVRQRPWNILDHYQQLLSEIKFDPEMKVARATKTPEETSAWLHNSSRESENRMPPAQSAEQLEHSILNQTDETIEEEATNENLRDDGEMDEGTSISGVALAREDGGDDYSPEKDDDQMSRREQLAFEREREMKNIFELEVHKKLHRYIEDSNRQLALLAEADMQGQKFQWSEEWPIQNSDFPKRRAGSPHGIDPTVIDERDVHRYKQWSSTVWERARKFEDGKRFPPVIDYRPFSSASIPGLGLDFPTTKHVRKAVDVTTVPPNARPSSAYSTLTSSRRTLAPNPASLQKMHVSVSKKSLPKKLAPTFDLAGTPVIGAVRPKSRAALSRRDLQ